MVITQYTKLEAHRRFGGTYRLHLQGGGVSLAREQKETQRDLQYFDCGSIVCVNLVIL
jgi:hypothetical protein